MSERALAIWLLLPAGLLLGFVALYPVVRLIYTSFFQFQLTLGPEGSFIGLANYAAAFEDPRFWNALKNTVLIVLITVPGALLVGLLLALLANLPFRVKWPVRLGLLLPWALPLVFVGLIFQWFFDSQYGVVNDWIMRLGGERQFWLFKPDLAFIAICFTIIWKTSSFVALILLAGLQTIPKELYEAAQVDGASRWQSFWRITLPLLTPAILVAMIFRTITAFQTFDIPYAMTKGGPGNATETLAMYVRVTSIENLNFGYGSALAVLLFLLSMVITVIYLRYIRGADD
ncbi:carbohydrate ABC transporter permease [Meiothermus hypogaeus]|uniref:Sugar ABC transporter permease n=2 Tax=Meiothermus hypogaeus TaxID=884155 RepID=A0A511QYL0_9DEIN|nr:sugar ABC transporter permease [Meiothermus hypogaeus]RIH75912.1 Lactose transport system permease protein LacF [Meiothermus hypogaeus]GEM82448.1 sugar ABC transporter permease [Meiothermus hypogaeus NBRC 106114]GIW37505.1 MAG: sugar ABC transporter permease [Meiothermus sp.]